MKFDNRIALIFGADEVGSAIAKGFIQHGVKVVITDGDKNKVEKARMEIGGDTLGLVCDVTNNNQINEVFNKTIEKFEKVDIVIYNSWKNQRKPIEDVSDELLDEILNKNTKSAFRIIRTAVKNMRKKRYGRIISTIALSGIMGISGEVPFSMAHASIMGLIRAVGREIGRRKITVNGVAIGFIDNEYYRDNLDDDTRKKASIAQFILRTGRVEEVVDAVLMFASDDSSWTTGEILLVGGGAYPR
ncbi:MAG: SDR family NAD(P)-dependent oxidoreductase [Candidatus Helarchaeota archaeon]